MNKERKVDNNAKPHGFKRQLEADKIIGATESNGQLMYLIKWKGTEEIDLVTSREANVHCPQVVIQFYEDRMVCKITKQRM